MRIPFLFVIMLLVFVAGCSSGDKMPKDVMPVSTMKVLIWEMSVADQVAADKYTLNKDSQRITATGLYQQVFALHKIDKPGFYRSFAYYEAHPNELKVLFDSAAAYGNRMKAKSYMTPK